MTGIIIIIRGRGEEPVKDHIFVESQFYACAFGYKKRGVQKRICVAILELDKSEDTSTRIYRV